MQHHFYTLPNQQKLHYTAWGSPSAQPVVCVHGLTRNARDFDYLARYLSREDDFYIICIDVLGRGQSSWASDPTQYSLLNYAQQTVQLLDALKLDKPHWIGTSMGGLIALTLQAIVPHRFNKLVLNDVGPVLETVALQRIAQYIGSAPRFESRALALAYAKIAFESFGASNQAQWAGLTDFYYLDEVDGSVRVHYDPVMATVTKAQVAGINPQALTAGQSALWASLQSLQQPVLVLRGEHSDLLTPETVAQMHTIQPLLSSATIPNCGHAPHLMDDAQVQRIDTFLKTLL
jgi:pimeloyl-ACP methyl ester carboxylesterase